MTKTIPFEVVSWAAREVQRQHDSAIYVQGMISAWLYAFEVDPGDITVEDLQILNALVKMRPVGQHFRQVNVMVGNDTPPQWYHVPRLIDQMLDNQYLMTAEELGFEYLKVHPESDGNGRTALLLINIKNKTLMTPTDLPEFDFTKSLITGQIERLG